MVAKYTSRWAFYRTAARLCNHPRHHLVREVVNPAKDSKLDEVACRHNLPNNFRQIAGKLRTVWPLLPSSVCFRSVCLLPSRPSIVAR
ncbi:hypothetical protein V8F20_003316 [Naviculisporaceae sp. PSN 640]